MHTERITWAVSINGRGFALYQVNPEGHRLEPVSIDVAPAPEPIAHRDRPVRTYQIVGERRGSGAEAHRSEQASERRFIEECMKALAAAAEGGRFDGLVLACGPETLGVVRACAPKTLQSLIIGTVRGDHVKTAPSEFYKIVQEALLGGA